MNTTPVAPSWLVRPAPNPAAALRLFCLPHAGGGTAAFRAWPASLPTCVEVCAVQLPGRETRFQEAPYIHWEPLVNVLADVLAAAIDRPYAIYGHSMGALLAFELVRQLRRLDRPLPACLFVAGHRAPRLPATEPKMHTLPEAEFRAELRRRRGTPDAVLNNAELMEALTPMLRADFSVCETYAYQAETPLDCPLAALGGQTDASVAPDVLAAWGQETSSTFESTLLPGGHFFPFTHPGPLLAYLRQALAQILGEQTPEWETPNGVLELAAGEVHVWRLALDRPEAEAERLKSLLDGAELERAGRFRFPRDRERFVVGRGLLRSLLGRYVGQAPAQLQFAYANAGKPLLRDHALQFNLAHSGGLALLAVAGRRTVGVNVEQVRPSLDIMTIAERYFAAGERAFLRRRLPNSNERLFSRRGRARRRT